MAKDQLKDLSGAKGVFFWVCGRVGWVCATGNGKKGDRKDMHKYIYIYITGYAHCCVALIQMVSGKQLQERNHYEKSTWEPGWQRITARRVKSKSGGVVGRGVGCRSGVTQSFPKTASSYTTAAIEPIYSFQRCAHA